MGVGQRNVALATRSTGEAEQLSSELRHHDVDAQPITNEAHRYVGGVVILPVYLAKGLEFDACLAVHADHEHYDPAVEYEQRLLEETATSVRSGEREREALIDAALVTAAPHCAARNADGLLHEVGVQTVLDLLREVITFHEATR